MTDETQNSVLALAVGKLTGIVEGLGKTLEKQNETTAANRLEVKEIFGGIREDFKGSSEVLRTTNQAVVELMTWKNDAKRKVDILWDTKNRQSGSMATMGVIGSVVGGAFVALVEYLKK